MVHPLEPDRMPENVVWLELIYLIVVPPIKHRIAGHIIPTVLVVMHLAKQVCVYQLNLTQWEDAALQVKHRIVLFIITMEHVREALVIRISVHQ